MSYCPKAQMVQYLSLIVRENVLRGIATIVLCLAISIPTLGDVAEQPNHSEKSNINDSDELIYAKLDGNHDLTLPDWGPYTKSYIGVSHIADKEAGIRFDLSVFPGYYRRKVSLPSVRYENNFHPWEAAPDLSYFSFRHNLEWKDQVYADISYSVLGGNARLVRAELVNRTDTPQSLVLHFLASISFPSIAPYSPDTPVQLASADIPDPGIWVDALDYQQINFAKESFRAGLVYDGWRRGEIRRHSFVNGSGIGKGFGAAKDDSVSYQVKLTQSMSDAVLALRYQAQKGGAVRVCIEEKGCQALQLKADDGLQVQPLGLGPISGREVKLTLESDGSAAFELDGFVLVDGEAALEKTSFPVKSWNSVPSVEAGPTTSSIVLKYPDADTYYGLRWYHDDTRVRQMFQQKLEGYFEHQTHHHNTTKFDGDRKGHHTNVFMRPLNIEPRSRRVVYAVVTGGKRAEIEKVLKMQPKNSSELEKAYLAARERGVSLSGNSAGKGYELSQRLHASVLLTNIVFPVYTQRQYIRHSAPGRWWDSLYTWDSGFIGIGLSNLDTRRSVENLNAYLTSADSESAFIHHGTPLPAQQYQFLQLWNKTQDTRLLENFYPKLRRYYRFLVGKAPGSSTAIFKSGLLKTWDYFYNSGGWDDYPPQAYVHRNKLTGHVSPVVSTAHAIRSGKILRMAAVALGRDTDVEEYDVDISRLTKALQEYAWDNKAGYFSYVLHDSNGNPIEQMTTDSGENMNKGLGGASPLIAGVTTEEQRDRLLLALKDEQRLFSPIGLSAVDQSASYFRHDGYWNGTVWMPHQWFYWKTLLDLGEHKFAYKVAKTALNLWKKETEATYNSFEHFVIATGRGAGWHHFGGLSAPVLDWYTAYFVPGTLTAGYNVWVEEKEFSENMDSLEAKLKLFPDQQNDSMSVLVTLNEQFKYFATWNDAPVNLIEMHQGTYSVQIPTASERGGRLNIFPSK